MKLSNKLIIISASLFVFAFVLLVSRWAKAPHLDPSSSKNKTEDDTNDIKTLNTESNISKPIDGEKPKNAYALKIVGERICAYMILRDGSEVLWSSTDIPPILSPDERNALKKGIYTDDFEELCLYFESYAS